MLRDPLLGTALGALPGPLPGTVTQRGAPRLQSCDLRVSTFWHQAGAQEEQQPECAPPIPKAGPGAGAGRDVRSPRPSLRHGLRGTPPTPRSR